MDDKQELLKKIEQLEKDNKEIRKEMKFNALCVFLAFFMPAIL